MYGGPQLSQQKQNTHSSNRLMTMTTDGTHRNQIALSTNQFSHSDTKSRYSEVRGNHLSVSDDDSGDNSSEFWIEVPGTAR